jgi:hypothetical protein
VRAIRVVDSRCFDEDLPTTMPGVSIMFEDRGAERELFVNDWFDVGRVGVADILRGRLADYRKGLG